VTQALVWAGFLVFIVGMVLLDLGVFHRRQRAVGLAEALAWTSMWIVLALVFNTGIYFLYGENWLGWNDLHSHALTGEQAAVQFFTGYLLEKSLSIDNIFVIAMIFAYFKVPLVHQHRLLFWGVLGAVVLRGAMIAAGAALLARFDWIMYVFGLLLIASAVRLLVTRHDNLAPDRNFLVRLARRVYPVVDDSESGRFFVELDGHRAMTPLFLALILVESSDILFAVDSIPAVFAVTRDPFLVFTSNVFAILGLRSLYFALAGLMDRFRYLKMSLVFLLAYVGVKTILAHHHPIPNLVSLAIIAGILSVGVVSSIVAGARDTAPLVTPVMGEIETLMTTTYHQARRVTILVTGSTVLLVGVAMIILPGPALLAIPLGLAILATEFAWARRWLARVRKASTAVSRRWRQRKGPDQVTNDPQSGT
jgi:tellurite resistance protein TerC